MSPVGGKGEGGEQRPDLGEPAVLLCRQTNQQEYNRIQTLRTEKSVRFLKQQIAAPLTGSGCDHRAVTPPNEGTRLPCFGIAGCSLSSNPCSLSR